MKILGIETSCDETAVSLVENGTKIISNQVSSSCQIQSQYGGVYPEFAAREQIKAIIPLLQKTPIKTIDALAVTVGPGLIGSLLIGIETAKTLSFALNKPIISVNHLLAHIYANFLEGKIPPFPLLCLIVSGGHTILLLMKNHQEYQVLGQTQDDAAGEAFDKTARIIGFSYPGGPIIEKAAQKGDPQTFAFPRGMIKSNNYHFSFSGLKTAVLRKVNQLNKTNLPINNLAASIQKAIVAVLAFKTVKAAKEYQPKSILLSGGVAANQSLRKAIRQEIKKEKLDVSFFAPSPYLCTDNAASVASCAFFHPQKINYQKIIAVPSLFL